jgi:hypothetical protein
LAGRPLVHTAFKLYPSAPCSGSRCSSARRSSTSRHRDRRGHRPGPVRQAVETGKKVNVSYGYLLGAALMIAAGVAEWLIGVEAAA